MSVLPGVSNLKVNSPDDSSTKNLTTEAQRHRENKDR